MSAQILTHDCFVRRIAVGGFGAYGPAIYLLSVIVTVLFSVIQLRNAIKGLQGGDKAFRAQIFMQITDKWSAIYKQRNAVLESEPTTVKQLEENKNYQENDRPSYRKFLASEEWKGIREVCNFFEFLGLTLHQGFIEAGPLFVLVTVEDKEGKMSRNLRPYIAYLRKHYRPDIYVFYDYLFEQYKNHKPLLPDKLAKPVFDPAQA
jgi:hypothetical protein